MAFAPENLGVSETGLPLLRDLIHERTGLSYDNGRSELLSDRLAPLVIARGFRSFLDFYYLLKYDDRSVDTEWRDLMNALSVPETYFWREFDQIRALACRVVPELVRCGGGQPIRIWSVPCATGEEPLTIAMALEEAGWFQRAAIEIHASDGSSSAVDKALAGNYRERSFRAIPAHLKEKYFTGRDGLFSPIPSLRARIASWSVVNLMDRSQVVPHASSPVIFCRNAFIYFSPQSVKSVVKIFEDMMPTPGFLFVGASESLIAISDRFTLEDIDRAFVYTKRST
jgi:chemotaxis protein methyltransferase CheR